MWYSKTINEILKQLDVNYSKGLSSHEVTARLETYGKNELQGKKPKNLFQLFLQQFNDVLIYILLIAAAVSGFLGEISDAVIIFIVIIINAVVGVIQESKAEKALEALKNLSTPRAILKRNGQLVEVASEEIVPGDIISLDAGRYVPCDLRIIDCINLQIEESALTGESVPVEKNPDTIKDKDEVPLGDQKNIAFMSTLVTYGRGFGVAVSTGMNTEMGKIATMLDNENNEKTPLQVKLAELGKILGFGAIIICTLMLIIGYLQGRDLLSMFLTAISLTVAAIPEGLAAVVTIVLAIGVQRMIKEHAIIRKLPAVETLGSVNIICSDKTGTLTQNKMTVTKYYTNLNTVSANDIDINIPGNLELVQDLMLCSDASYNPESETGDPTEIALLVLGFKNGVNKIDVDNKYPRLKEIPFDSKRKLMSTMHKFETNYKIITKGAVDNLLPLCNSIYLNGEVIKLDEDTKFKILDESDKMSDDALRVLAVAFKSTENPNIETQEFENSLTFVGLVGMIDPPRLEVKDSILLAKNSGIKTIMITGDHKSTAFAIAKSLSIANNKDQVMSGSELNKLSDSELEDIIDNLRVFARVSPEHKVRIVKAFKKKDNIVAMTGDGVNDAPSLKAADIGIAMGITGTDVSKGAADMVLTDDNFATIVKAVKEGRYIYNNIQKSIFFLLSCNLGEIFCIFLAISLGWDAPLLPIHILWINLITDTLPALALGTDIGDPEIMKEKPRNTKDSLFKGSMSSIILNGMLIGTLTLLAFIIGIRINSGHSPLFPIIPAELTATALTHGRTMAFIVLSVSQLIHSLNLRSKTKSIFSLGLFSNKYLIWAIFIGLFLQNIVIAVPFLATIFKVNPLNLKDWLVVVILCIMPLLINEIVKYIIRVKNKHKVQVQ